MVTSINKLLKLVAQQQGLPTLVPLLTLAVLQTPHGLPIKGHCFVLAWRFLHRARLHKCHICFVACFKHAVRDCGLAGQTGG